MQRKQRVKPGPVFTACRTVKTLFVSSKVKGCDIQWFVDGALETEVGLAMKTRAMCCWGEVVVA
jgi:hypothetical protein